MKSFEELLEEATRIHGHVCAGQVIGVRMCMLALSYLKITIQRALIVKNCMYLLKLTDVQQMRYKPLPDAVWANDR